MTDLIDRQAAIKTVRELYIIEPKKNNDYAYDQALDQVEDILREIPSAEPEQKTGKWINCGCASKCSECGHLMSWDVRNFCPKCGAEMRKEE